MKKLVCFAFIAILMPAAARAQRWEFSVLGAYPRWGKALLGSLDPTDPQDNDTSIKGEYAYGARITLNTRGYYGHEISYLFQRAKFTTHFRTTTDDTTVDTLLRDRITIQQAAYNFLIYFMPAGERWRPFITGGMQANRFGAPTFAEWPGGGSTNWGANYGAGLKVKLFQHALVRLDFRDYLNGKPYVQLEFADVKNATGIIHMLQGSAGVSITF
jgi:hypothetical protein